MSLALLLVLLTADPNAEQHSVLKTFREEFVEITPTENATILIAKYEVPQNLWEAVLGDNPSKWKGKRNSVEFLTYADAVKFCSEATRQMRAAKLIDEEQTVRLPTEVEWEFACRAGSKGDYSFGDDPKKLGEYAWFNGNAAGNDPPVGAKKPNAFGLYDMHGYLWEFCVASDDAKQCMIRGGSWKDTADKLRCDARQIVPFDLKDDAIGLRCVLAPAGKTGVAADGIKPLAQDKFFAAEAKFEVVWGDGEFTEGPALGPDGKIYFSDIGNKIYVFDPATKKTDIYRDPSGRSNGLIFDKEGRLYAAEGANTGGGRRISITEKNGKVRTLADKYEGKRFNSPNDLAVDRNGTVYFTDPRYVGNDPRELDFECVFYVDSDGKARIATDEVQKPNGIVLSPDEGFCYVADNNPKGKRQLLKFSVLKSGKLGYPRVLHDFGTGRGIDGMTVDRDGYIFATAGTGDKAGIYVFDPAGAIQAFVATPGDPTNCEFGGGDEKSVLYVTTALPGKPTKYGLARISTKTGR